MPEPYDEKGHRSRTKKAPALPGLGPAALATCFAIVQEYRDQGFFWEELGIAGAPARQWGQGRRESGMADYSRERSGAELIPDPRLVPVCPKKSASVVAIGCRLPPEGHPVRGVEDLIMPEQNPRRDRRRLRDLLGATPRGGWQDLTIQSTVVASFGVHRTLRFVAGGPRSPFFHQF